jgi:hypothetical protein
MALLRAIGFGAALGLSAAAGAQTVVDLYGVEQATLEWMPASGSVSGYYVIVSRNGGTPTLYGVSNDTREDVASPIGDVITVQVAAFDAAGLAGPLSPPSDPLRFNPATAPPPPDGDGGSGGGTTDPDPGDGGSGDSGSPSDGTDVPTPAGPARFDFTGDGRSDLLLRDPTRGELRLFTLDAEQVTAQSSLPHLPYPWYLEESGDFDGDGTRDLLWRNRTSGKLTAWIVREGAVQGGAALEVPGIKLSRSWKIGGCADFDGDGRDDVVLTHPSKGYVEILAMDGARVADRISRSAPSAEWRVAATPDADGDGIAEIVWSHVDTEALRIEWISAPRQATSIAGAASGWRLLGSADADGDGRDDLWMRHRDTRIVEAWLLDGATAMPTGSGTKPGDSDWQYRGLGDFDGDGRADAFWHHPDGFVEIWFTGDAGVEAAFVSERTDGDKVVGDEGD